MSERKQSIRDYVVHKHEESWRILQTLSTAELDLPVYDGGTETGWTIGDIVAHLADAESGLLTQAKRVAAGERPLPPDFDIDRWNRSAVRRRKEATFEDHLQAIEDAHQAALDFLDEVDEENLDREGIRPGQDRLTVEGFFRRMVNHRAQHVEDIQRARKGTKSGE